MTSIHCFYHGADLDGHCSGAIVKYRFPEAIMHSINYGDTFPWEEIKEDDEVYMVDFCLQPFDPDMLRLIGCCNLTWIDHHSSAVHEYIRHKPIHLNRCTARYDITKAACELTWEYLYPDKPVPLAVKLLSLYDSWTYQGHELEDRVLPFQMRMRMEELDPKNFKTIRNSPWIKFLGPDESAQNRYVEEYVDEGRLLLRYDEAQKTKYARTYAFETELPIIWPLKTTCSLRPYKAIALNLGHTNSKVFDSVWRKKCPECGGDGMIYDCLDHTGCVSDHKLPCPMCHNSGYLEPYDLMITFVRRQDKLWDVSLYSTKKDVDCGAIAKSFGGGGHKGAAGFQCKELPFEY